MVPRTSDTARQRELYKYYQPEHSLLAAPGQATFLHGSNDLSLTAFAQIGAFRLNAQRGIISFIGQDIEYVIAEAGKTLSLQSDHRHIEGDELWFGVGPLRAGFGLGLTVMNILTDQSHHTPRNVIISDLRQDERFSQLSMVTGPPFARFLVSLPLRTPTGYPIGLYSVIGDQPRASLTHVELAFLQDMASTTMGHIESGRIRQKHHRAERMVKAVGLFLEGGGSLRDWWISQGEQSQHIQQDVINEQVRRGLSVAEQADIEFGVRDKSPDRGSYVVRGLNEHDLKNQQATIMSASPSILGKGRPSVPTNRTLSSTNSTSESTDLPSNFTNTGVFAIGQDSATTPDTAQSSLKPAMIHLRPEESHPSSTAGKPIQEALLSVDLKESFSRASNLIREAIDVDGVAFFDASTGPLNASSTHAYINDVAPRAYTNLPQKIDTTSSTSEEDKKITSESDGNGNRKDDPSESHIPVLGYSTKTRSSLNGHDPSDAQQSFSEQLMRQLTKCYPHGKIFNFNESGSISTDSEALPIKDQESATSIKEELDGKRARHKRTKRMSREQEAVHVLKVVPGARRVAWFPLWDPARERWYAGILLWSTLDTRIFSPEEEIVYLASFGNSIMAEVSRMSALVASQLKVDFVSSISHDLRSPLHGILANVEFLQEDHNLTSGQEDIVNTINNCGRTLLQTIDHVLDFAEFTQKKQKKGSKRLSKDLKDRREPGRSSAQLSDIRSLAEEVIDSVYAGRRSWKSGMTMHNAKPVIESILSTPIVILDIVWHENWHYGIDGGAWRRILMNLFSNAMKYTDKGFVHVLLRIDHDSIPGQKKPRPRLSFEVKDSGRGISKEFLKSHIYTAFKQENDLSVGTGLGLSIVRQIVHDLHGTIEIRSEVGEGTQAYVSIPLTSARSSNLRNKADAMKQFREKTTGLKACLINAGFDIFPAMFDAPSGILSPEAEALILLKASIRSMLVDWFGMEVIISPRLDLTQATIHLMFASKTMDEDTRAALANFDSQEPAPIVIVICNIPLVENYVTDHGVHVFYVQQPVSPRSFAAVLSRWYSSKENTVPHLSSDVRPSHQLSLPYVKSQRFDHRAPSPQEGESISSNTVSELPRDSNATGSEQTQDTNTIIASIPIMNQPQACSRILLVEDSDINLKLLVLCMTKANQPHATATNGAEAVAAYKTAAASSDSRFTAIFMDIQMPVQDGLSSTQEIRQFEHEHNLPRSVIIALTASVSASVRQDALRSGMDDFLTKPVAMKKLKRIVSGLRGETGNGKEDGTAT